MRIVETKEENISGVVYIINKYDNGYTEKYIKPDPDYIPPEPEPSQEAVTLESLKAQMDAMSRVQRGRTEINGEAITIAIDPVDPMAVAVTLDVQGTDAAYAYSISAEALTVMFTEKVKAYINWEVRG